MDSLGSLTYYGVRIWESRVVMKLLLMSSISDFIS